MKKQIIYYTTFIVLIGLNINNVNSQFYVSTTGLDNNSGTLTSPWKTIAKAANTLTAGQTAYVRGGTYKESITIKNSGTVGKYITIAAYPTETPIMDGTGINAFNLINISNKSYVKISGLSIQNSSVGIAASGSNNLVLENNKLYNFNNPAISLGDCFNSVVTGNIVDKACSTSWGECITFNQCEYIDVSYNEVKNGTTNTLGGEGIDIKCSKYVRVYGNVVHDLKKLGIYIDAYDGLNYDIQVFNNKVYNVTSGIVISSEQRNAVRKINVYNNLVYDCVYLGIGVVNWPTHYTPGTSYPIDDIKIENNTISSTGGLIIDAPEGNNFKVQNNIIYNYNPSIKYSNTPQNLVSANNMANLGAATYLGTNGKIADPQFVNIATKDFQLKSTSPAIDYVVSNGVLFDLNNKTRPYGSGLDLGAYEYGSTTVTGSLPAVVKPAFTTFNTLVNASGNDAVENNTTKAVTINTGLISMSFTKATGDKNIAALRFTNIQLPKGANILNAHIKVKAARDKVFDDDPIQIVAENIANSPILTTTAGNLSSRTKTASYANWLPGACSIDDIKSTPSLDFIINELITRADWVSGNAMTFFFEYNSTADGDRLLNTYSFDSTLGASELSIEYNMDVPNDIPTIKTQNELKIYPNPAKERIIIKNLTGKISILNLLGQQVRSINNYQGEEINISSIPTGTYIVKTTNAAKQFLKN